MNNTEQVFIPSGGASIHVQQRRPPRLSPPKPLPTVNLQNVEDFSKVCRVCALVSETVMPIFSEEGLQNKIADLINKFLPIQVVSGDQLPMPMAVCYPCANTLLAAQALARRCVQADAALRTRSSQLASKRLEAQKKERFEKVLKKHGVDAAFNAVVRKVLVNYFHTLNMDEDNLDLEFVCQKCKSSCTCIESLAAHLATAHALDTSGDVSSFIRENITFEEPLKLESQSPEAPAPPASPLPAYCCPFCENVFSNAARLACHLSVHVEISPDSGVECCGAVFSDRRQFISHCQERHAGEAAPGACRACGLRAGGARALAAHVRRAHAGPPARRRRASGHSNQKYIPTPCPDCGKTFSNKYNMAVHARSHRGAETERFSCSQCTREYGSRGSLAAHVKVAHEGVLRFACETCGECFATRSARESHAALHSGALAHVCAHAGCGRAFRARNTLLRHMDAHRARAHACPRCPRAFRRAAHLAQHAATHRPPSNEDRLLQGP